MDFDFSAEQQSFRQEVRRFIAERLPADIRERMRLGYHATKEATIRWQRILNERGWGAPHWPKAHGGADLGTAERIILFEELAMAPAPYPLIFNIAMLGPVLIEFGTDRQKRDLLPRLANLDVWFCQGFSEPGAGSDLAALRTAARREGDHYVVDGQKIWTTTAHLADWMFALVRTEKSARKQDGISFVLIDMRSPGITIRPIVSIDGMHHLNEVFFDNVRVPVENLVGTEGRGWDVAKFLLGNERAAIANVGNCRERLGYARELAGRIQEGGQALLDDPRLQAELAVLDAEVRALDITNWRFLMAPESAPPAYASLLKLKGVQIRQEIYALIARLAGPAGLERPHNEGTADSGQGALAWEEMPVSYYLYSRALSILGGSTEIQNDIVAKTVVG